MDETMRRSARFCEYISHSLQVSTKCPKSRMSAKEEEFVPLFVPKSPLNSGRFVLRDVPSNMNYLAQCRQKLMVNSDYISA